MKVLGFSSIRSDYDLMSGLYKKLNEDKFFDFRLIVSGANLSDSYGLNISNIVQDGIPILARIVSLIDSDIPIGRLKTMNILMSSLIDQIYNYKPDLMIFAGDREDALVYAIVAGYLRIPTIHFFGGDHASDGNIDNPVRHAISKLCTYHFVSHNSHKQRLIKVGESEHRIFNIGSIALDRFNSRKYLTKDRLLKKFKLDNTFSKYALLVFHPILQHSEISWKDFQNIIIVLQKFNIKTFVGYPNTDPGNHKIIELINNLPNTDFFVYKNLDDQTFSSILINSEFVIGNSSLGILEAASFLKPVINVGLRQKGRIADRNVIFCDSDEQSIFNSVEKAISNDFLSSLKGLQNSYGDGNSIPKCIELMKTLKFEADLFKREDPLFL